MTDTEKKIIATLHSHCSNVLQSITQGLKDYYSKLKNDPKTANHRIFKLTCDPKHMADQTNYKRYITQTTVLFYHFCVFFFLHMCIFCAVFFFQTMYKNGRVALQFFVFGK